MVRTSAQSCIRCGILFGYVMNGFVHSSIRRHRDILFSISINSKLCQKKTQTTRCQILQVSTSHQADYVRLRWRTTDVPIMCGIGPPGGPMSGMGAPIGGRMGAEPGGRFGAWLGGGMAAPLPLCGPAMQPLTCTLSGEYTQSKK